ncbi:hypothetical protein HPHPP74_1618 [Helicobacter pylori Hp P-74]|nr:hypothetical protein HPHPP74_1618 [Helicobacter pylori Hp P-74]
MFAHQRRTLQFDKQKQVFTKQRFHRESECSFIECPFVNINPNHPTSSRIDQRF